MATYETLRQAINSLIKTNGNEEITGAILNQVLNAMITALGANYQFCGEATPSTNPGQPMQNVFYFAYDAGTYVNFGNINLPMGISTLSWDGTQWTGETIYQIDSTPVLNSTRLITSGGVYNALAAIIQGTHSGFLYAGIAEPTDSPSALVNGQRIFYIATQAGTYNNFLVNYDIPMVIPNNGIWVLTSGADDDDWTAQEIVGIDDKPTSGSNALVKSGGVFNELALGAVYDVSAKNPTAGPNNDGKWESLSALLSDTNLNTLIPVAFRKGGMSIKFVHTSDNKYVQARLMANSFTTDVTQWQGVDNNPTAGSDNLVKSGGVYSSTPTVANSSAESDLDISDEEGYVLVRCENGHIRTKNFSSAKNNANIGIDSIEAFNEDTNYSIGNIVKYDGLLYKFIAAHTAGGWNIEEVEQTNLLEATNLPVDVSDNISESDLDISDEEGYVLARFKNGHIKTKNFDSEDINNGVKTNTVTITLGISVSHTDGSYVSFPDNKRMLFEFDSHQKTKIWVKDGFEFLVARYDKHNNFLFADLGFSYRNIYMVLDSFEGKYKIVLRRTDQQAMTLDDAENLVFEENESVNFEFWNTPQQTNEFAQLQITADDFLAQYYDIYLQSEQRDYTKIEESDVNGWKPYIFVKNDLGLEDSEQYHVYEYVFTPKRYNKTILLSALMHGQEIVGGFSLARFFWYLFNHREAHPIFDYIYNNVRIACIPVQNPYGFNQSPRQFGPYCVDGGAPTSMANVTVNFDQHGNWENSSVGDSNPNSSSWFYKGTAPYSMRGTQILRNWLEKYKQFATFWIDCHTGAGWSQDIWAYYVDTDTWLKPRMIKAASWLSNKLQSECNWTLQNRIEDRWTSEKLHWAYRMLGLSCMTLEHVPARYGGVEGGSRDIQVYLRNLTNFIIAFLNNDSYGNNVEDIEVLKNQMAKALRYDNEPFVWDEEGNKYRIKVDSTTGNLVTEKIEYVEYNAYLTDREWK